jgi:hypothetical protein
MLEIRAFGGARVQVIQGITNPCSHGGVGVMSFAVAFELQFQLKFQATQASYNHS